MNTNMHVNRRGMKRTVAFLLCVITLFSVLSFAGGTVFQLATTASAAAETERVVIKPTYTYEFDENLYESLLKQLNAQLKKKKFSKIANTFLREILRYEVENYPQWQNVYPDLPSTAAFIKENLINVIPQIQKIKMIDKNSEAGRIFAEKVDYAGATNPASKGYAIRSLYTNPTTLDISKIGDRDTHLYDLQTLAHEIRHAKDGKGLSKQRFPSHFIDMVISDGATTFHERFVSPMQTFQGKYENLYTKKGTYIQFVNESKCSYTYYRSFYDSLIYLAGYPTMNAVGEGKSLKTITRSIAKRYGQDTANRVWKILKSLPNQINLGDGWLISNKAVNLTTEFFQILLQCIKKDIQKLDTSKPKTVRKYMDVYRNIKLKVLPQIINANDKIVNDKYFNTKELDSLLAKKVIASKALPTIYENPGLNRQAVIEMLYCDQYLYETTIDVACYLPATIAQTEYTFTMDNGKAIMVEYFLDEDQWEVLFTCIIDEKGTTSRTGDYL